MGEVVASSGESLPSSAGDWEGVILSQLVDRNRKQTSPFSALVQSHLNIWKQARALEIQNRELDKQLVISRHENSISASGGGSDKVHQKQARKITELEHQISKLRDELATKYKKEANSANSQLELSSAHRSLQKEHENSQAILLSAQMEVSTLRQTIQSLQTTDEEKDKMVEVLRNEIDGLQSMLVRSEEKVMKLMNENNAILERVKEEKIRLMDEMNRMTELNAELQMRMLSLQNPTHKQPPTLAESAESSAGNSSGRVFFSEKNNTKSTAPEKPMHAFRAHDTEIPSLCFNEEGTRLATGGCDGTIRLWSLSSKSCNSVLRSTSSSGGVATNAILNVDIRGNFVLGGGSDRSCRVWSLETETIQHKFTGHSGKIYAGKLSPDCKIAATGSTDRKVMIWDLETGHRLRNLSCGSTCNSLDINEGGTLMITGHQDNRIRLWDLRNGSSQMKVVQVHNSQVTSTCFSRDGRKLLTASMDNSLCYFNDINKLVPTGYLKHNEYRNRIPWARACFNPSAKLAAAGSADGAVYIWDVVKQKAENVLRSHTSPVTGVSWSNTGNHLATCDQSGFVVLWK